nr:nuclear transport factor 2 family protein [Kibdelosporangium sp. MJ126-NF4]CEL15945.1 hypothetical protein [Kibdelosporangium sp. MJ126-NF4]CTQ93869.1 hypothetical protein [Kibdelosporangium sp. MJ126-NF4]
MAEENEKTMIAETVTRLFHALDERDWDTIIAVTADPVDVDYPSKQGGPEQISTRDLVTGLRAFLPGFDATQHLTGAGCRRSRPTGRGDSSIPRPGNPPDLRGHRPDLGDRLPVHHQSAPP